METLSNNSQQTLFVQNIKSSIGLDINKQNLYNFLIDW